MRKLMVFFVLALVTTVTTISPVVGSGEKKDVKNGPATIIVNGGGFGDIPFPHRTHQETLVDCRTCHDLFPQKIGSIVALKSSKKLKKRQVMNQCKACHYDRRDKGQKAGPTGCNGCHKR